jgi:hypothetical protein
VSLPIGWQWWLAMEAESSYQLWNGHHDWGSLKAQQGPRDKDGTLIPIGWKRGTAHSRARFWIRWVRDRSDARLGFKPTRWSRHRRGPLL